MSYIDELEAAFEAHPNIADYRINLNQLRSIGLGIRDNDVGSVYSPFSFRQNTSGEFLVQWRDGRLSRGKLDSNTLPIIEQVLANAYQAAYADPDAAQFLGPQEIHEVPLFAEEVPGLFTERTGYLLDVVAELQRIAQRYDTNTLTGGAGGGMGNTWLRTSRGLQLHATGTSFSYSAAFDGVVGEERNQPAIPALTEIATHVDRVAAYLEPLRTPASRRIADGTRMVVLYPDVAYKLFNYYVWGNLSGAAVFHGQSPLRSDDFHSRRQVFRDDLMVTVDPWQPLGPGSFMYTSEGVPSAPTVYIERGCVTQPVLDLKYARRLGLPPNTPPRSEQIVHIHADGELAWDELEPQLDEAILVLSVLGLHTQDRTSGNYSLSTSQALLIGDGAAQGRIKATLNGNLFDNLRSPDLRLVRFPGQHNPGFALPLSVAIEQTA